jgi:hypothetical protein
MSEEPVRTCPVPHCTNKLGTTKAGNPWAMCRRHYHRLDAASQMKLWRAYGSWQRLERQWLGMLPGMRPPALQGARAVAIQAYLDVRDDCIRKASDGDHEQLEVAL